MSKGRKKKQPENKEYTVRVRETVIRLYTVYAPDEDSARENWEINSAGPPLEVDRMDWDVESVRLEQ